MVDDDHETLLFDTSAALALVLRDHESHDATIEAIQGRRLGLAGHAWFETYSILTRLPPSQRLSPADAFRVLGRDFPESSFLGEAQFTALGQELARLGIAGGAVYDALVAAVARQHRRTLVSRDARARPIYDALGVEVEFIL